MGEAKRRGTRDQRVINAILSEPERAKVEPLTLKNPALLYGLAVALAPVIHPPKPKG